MASFLHALVLVFMLVRSVPSAISRPVVNAVIHDRLSSRIRATYFSMQSLAGRLAFSVTLFVACWSVAENESLTFDGMSSILGGFAILALCLAPLLVMGAVLVNRGDK